MTTDDDAAGEICDICLGGGGEWIDRNGTSPAHQVWVPCSTCAGTGRR
ncbi:J domain-containing protein [Streptosporangium soli]|nr:hypothetical protein [Streptosporangium sp. KLBMP 9127]